ncbi:MAG: tRNA (guanine(10)-N(2))-dimethyltransferase [Nitrososphaerales archaeon]
MFKIDIVEVKEEDTIILAPKSSVFDKIPPKSPAFYNPAAKLNRDVSLRIYSAYARLTCSNITFGDALAGVGARGLRVAKECKGVAQVYLNDLNPKAIELARYAAELNGVSEKCVFTTKDAILFLAEHSQPARRFDILDIDPFGSPTPFLAAALRAVKRGGLISLTATDTAVLCGVYPKVALRRYGGLSIRCEYGNEVGVRLLFGAASKLAMSMDAGIIPVFAQASRHYIRVYFTLEKRASKAEENLTNIGYLNHCIECGYREVGASLLNTCPKCKAKMLNAGPLWIGEINSKSILENAVKLNSDTTSAVGKIVSLALGECGLPPTYYIVDKIADRLDVLTPRTEEVITRLKTMGFRAARTIFNPKGIRTDASKEDVEAAVLGLKK